MAYTTIDDPTIYFNTKLYTGNGSTQSITGVGFQPDWLWIKQRSNAENHFLFDAVRGVNKRLISNLNGAESTEANSMTSFDSDGFSLGNGRDEVNQSGASIVAWNWKAGGSASSNSNGSITSSVSASTTAGFSIVSYTGTGSAATVGHGLGSAPSVIWTKTRSNAEQWFCHFSFLGTGSFIKLDTTDAAGTNTTAFPFNPQANTFGLSSDGATNTSSRTYIAYCFAEKKGYSKFGSYTGNGNAADGTFVYTGFKPSFVFLKGSSFSGGNWFIHDNKRSPFNQSNKWIRANTSDAEVDSTGGAIDMYSNGWKLKTSDSSLNDSGQTYIYMAFAESPFVNSAGAVPNNAR